MQVQIGEHWNGHYCALCEKYVYESHSCHNCPLYEAGYGCKTPRSPWKKVNESKTWGEWVKNARVMLEILKELEDETSN